MEIKEESARAFIPADGIEPGEDIRVVLAGNGSWVVVDRDYRTIRANFKTNAAAWDWANGFAHDYWTLLDEIAAKAAEIRREEAVN